MKNYQLTYLISPELSEEEAAKLSEQIVSFIQEREGTLDKSPQTIKKKLGQPIKNKTTAYSIVLNFHLKPEKIIEIEKNLKNEPGILRHLISKAPTQKIVKERELTAKFFKKAPATKLKSGEQFTGPLPQERKKVGLKEIEKKLEEILKI